MNRHIPECTCGYCPELSEEEEEELQTTLEIAEARGLDVDKMAFMSFEEMITEAAKVKGISREQFRLDALKNIESGQSFPGINDEMQSEIIKMLRANS